MLDEARAAARRAQDLHSELESLPNLVVEAVSRKARNRKHAEGRRQLVGTLEELAKRAWT